MYNGCIPFLGLPSQSTTNQGAYGNRNFTVLEAWNSKAMCWGSHVPRPLRENLPLPHPASTSPRRPLVCGSVTPISASIFTWRPSFCVCVSLSLHGILPVCLFPNFPLPIRADLMTSAMTLFPNKITLKCTVLGLQHISLEDTIQPTTIANVLVIPSTPRIVWGHEEILTNLAHRI